DDAVLPVEEVRRGDLVASAQREQHAVGHVPRREARPRRLGPIHAHLELRIVEVLLDAEIREAGHLAQLVQDLVGNRPVALDVVSLDLHVNGGGETEVQDLGDDVRGHEIKGDAGELLGQTPAKSAHVIGGGAMAFLQGGEDVGGGGAGGGGAAVHVVDGAVRQADVVDDVVQLVGGDLPPDGPLHQIRKAGRLLDAGARLGAEVEDELSVVAGGEEVLAEPWHEEPSGEAGHEEERDESRLAGEEALKEAAVGGGHLRKAALEAGLEEREGIAGGRRLSVRVRAQEIHSEGGHQRAGKDVGGEHGEHHRLRQRHEQIARHAAQEEHGQKHDADAESGDEGGHGDLGRALEDGGTQLAPLLEVALDVLDGNGGVVDQDAHGEGEAAQGHDVDGLAQEAQDHHRGEDGERDGHRDDERASPAPQEEQD